MEIFTLLVKNQDPDANPRLYTNLFTRPATGKRLEALIEDAFAGKGLSEVSYKFRASAIQAPVSQRQYEHADSHNDEYAEDYDSYAESREAPDTEEPENDEGEEDEETEGPRDQSPSTQSGEHANFDAAFEQQAADFEAEINAGRDDGGEDPLAADEAVDEFADDVVDDTGHYDDAADNSPKTNVDAAFDGKACPSPCYKPDFCFCWSCIEESSANIRRECAELPADDTAMPASKQHVSGLALRPCSESSMGVTAQSQVTARNEDFDMGSSFALTTNANILSQASANHDEITGRHDASVDQSGSNEALQHDDLDFGLDDTAADGASKVTDTSGTVTLDGEDEIDYEHVSELPGNAASDSAPAGLDLGEEGEIQWNDTTELADEAPSTKRPREEDEPAGGQEDEQGKHNLNRENECCMLTCLHRRQASSILRLLVASHRRLTF